MSTTAVSLFSGIEGFGLGLERAGLQVAGQVEIDPACRGVLARHFPDVPRWADITEVDPDELPRADLVCGGFPCQDISVAGRRAGLAGARSGLWWQFRRVLAAVRPRWVVIENVPGLLSSNDGRDMGAILGALGDLGYGWAYRVLDAQHFGLAQRRRRVFIVGCLGDRRAPAQVLLEPESGPRHPAPRRTSGERVAASLTAGVAAARGVNAPGRRAEDDVNLVVGTLMAGSPLSYRTGPDEAAAGHLVVGALTGAAVHGGADDNDAQAGHLIATAITARHGKGVDSDATTTLVTHALTAEGADASEDGTGRGTPLVAYNVHAAESCAKERHAYESDTARSLDTTGGFATNQGGTVVAFDWQAGGHGDESFRGKSRIYAVRKGDYTGSLQETKRDAVMTGSAVRRLTPTECERLQGFPDGWTAGQADSVRYRQLGNAVAVPVAEWIGRRILAVQGAA